MVWLLQKPAFFVRFRYACTCEPCRIASGPGAGSPVSRGGGWCCVIDQGQWRFKNRSGVGAPARNRGQRRRIAVAHHARLGRGQP